MQDSTKQRQDHQESDYLPYDLVGPIGSECTLGLVVLQTDETIESEFKRMFPSPNAAVYVTRIAMGNEVTENADGHEE